MICDMNDRSDTFLLRLDVVTIAMVVNLDVDIVCLGKCSNFHVVAVSAAGRHALEMLLPCRVDLFLGWRSVDKRS